MTRIALYLSIAWFVVLVAASMFFVPQVARATTVTLGTLDTFQDGTTNNWTNGGLPDPVNVSTGGPAGSGDRFLQVSSGGSNPPKSVVLNRSQWVNDYTAGVTKIAMDLKNFGGSALPMRIALRSGTGGQATPGYVTTNAFSLPADNAWHHAVFSLDAASLTDFNSPGALATFLQSVQEFRILSSVSASLLGDSITAQFGVDNIQAVPEPSGILLSLIAIPGLVGCARRLRRQR